MVKQVFSFLRWQVSRFKWSDYLWFSAWVAVAADWETKGIVFFIGITAILTMTFGYLLGVQWSRWKEERKQLLSTIKDSK